MRAEDILVIIAWVGIACIIIGLGLSKTRIPDAQQSCVFQPGHEWYSSAYTDAITGMEQEWMERQRT